MQSLNKFFYLILTLSLIACSGNYQKTENGISVALDSGKVIVVSAQKNSFSLSLRKHSENQAISSVFIAEQPDQKPEYRVVEEDHAYGIETSFGRLMVDTENNKWSMWDENKKLIIKDGEFVIGDSVLQILLSKKGLLYGSGNYTTKHLIKKSSSSRMGNGTTDIPYLWNDEGYSLFGVSEDDDLPASWACNEEGDLIWNFSGQSADLYLWTASTSYEATEKLMNLTGQAKLPPKWAFGFLQCQWGWLNRDYIENVLRNFREKNLPVDAFIYDFEWYTTFPDYSVNENGIADFSDFGFNSNLFPEPEKQIENYKSEGVKFIGIRKPRLGDSTRLVMARSNKWITNSDYNNRDMDFRNPDLRKWYIEQNKPLLESGVNAWWNDEGESYYTCYYWWNKAESDMLAEIKPGDRHFSINRSFSPGNQRLGYCTWNGDINSDWQSFRNTPADLLNWSLSGMFYGSCDIGGFGTKNPDKELVVRWYQAATFFPIMRAHSNLFTTPRFPWLWDEKAIQKSLNLRYQLIPYIYSLGLEAYLNGTPIMRPLMMEFPQDEKLADMTDQWLLGSGLMAAPVLNAGGTRSVYFPEGIWYDFFTGLRIEGPQIVDLDVPWDKVPVFVRAGTILPLGPVIQSTEEKSDQALEIRVYPGKDGNFTFLEDDGKTYEYTQGKLHKTVFNWEDKTNTLKWKVSGNYNPENVVREVKVVVGKSVKYASIDKDGKIIF